MILLDISDPVDKIQLAQTLRDAATQVESGVWEFATLHQSNIHAPHADDGKCLRPKGKVIGAWYKIVLQSGNMGGTESNP